MVMRDGKFKRKKILIENCDDGGILKYFINTI